MIYIYIYIHHKNNGNMHILVFNKEKYECFIVYNVITLSVQDNFL